MERAKIPFYFSCLVLVAALLRWPTYTFPFRTLGSEYFWSMEILAGNVLGILFLLLPILAFVGFLRHWRSAYVWLGLSPVVFFLFGSVPIPLAGYFYSNNQELNTIIIAAVDIAAVLAVVWLYRSAKTRSNQSLKSGTPQSGAP